MPSRLLVPAALVAVLVATGCASGASGPAQWRGTTGDGAGSSGASSLSDSGGGGEIDPQTHAEALSRVSSTANPGEPGVPPRSGASVDDVLRLGAVAAWVDGRETFAVSLPASADCWASAGEPVVAAPDRLAVGFVIEETCALGDSARTYTMQVPEGVDSSAGLDLAIVGLQQDFTLTLPAP